MKVLLTGASGFIGRHVLGRLKKHNIDTIVAGRNLPDNVSPADFIQIDMLEHSDFVGLVAESGATHLLHLAWYTEHGKYWSSPLNIRWVEATTRLVDGFCLSNGKKVVVAGTCAEYDWSFGYCREDITPLNPDTLYGIAKDSTRRLVMAICAQYKIPCAWGRIFLPYGQGENCRRLIPSLIEVFQGKKTPFKVNATAFRDFLHADDLAEGFMKLLLTDATGAYNICSGQPVQIGELVRHIAELYDANPQAILELSTNCSDAPSMLVGDNQKIKALGWEARYSLADYASGWSGDATRT